MKQRRALALGLLGFLTFPTVGIPAASATPTPDIPVASQEHSSHRINVIVMLKDQPGTPSEATERANVSRQDALIASWGPQFGLEVSRQFGFLVNGFSATIPANQMLALSQQPEVESVKLERLYYPNEYNARDMHGAPAAFGEYGVDGTGTVVSIIDSGIDIEHQDMRLDDGVCEVSKLTPAEGFTCKVPFGFNYADDNSTVKDLTPSQHGMHVAGIVGANGSEGDDPAQPLETDGRFDGVAPNAQLLAMKVFSNNTGGGAYDSDIIAAIEDSYKLGADVINMSLGSPNGQKDASDGSYRAIEKAREHGVLTVVAAGNDGLNFSATGLEDDIQGLWDDGTVGQPATQGSAFSVASIDNNFQMVPVAYWNEADASHELIFSHQVGEITGDTVEIVDVGLSLPEDYLGGVDLTGKYALVERGDNTFTEKFENAINAGAEGVVVFNHEAGGNDFVGMAGIENFDVLGVSILREDGLAIREALADGTVTVQFTNEQKIDQYAEGYRPSGFTSWGPTPTLDFEPEIAGIGGSVYSTLNDNQYGTMSGTSMASPNVAGLSALLLEEYKTRFPELTGPALVDRLQVVLMNTAIIPTNAEGVAFAPRQIGAGLVDIKAALDTPVFATVDGLPKVELREVSGNETFTVTLTNTGDEVARYTIPGQFVINETNDEGADTTTYISGESLTPNTREVSVPAGGTASVTFTLVPDTSYDHYIEGWATFTGINVPDLAVPYLGFVGDWNAEPIVKAPGETWVPVSEGDGFIELLEWSTTDLMWELFGFPSSIDIGGGRWISPNDDGVMDNATPQLLLMRTANEFKYEVYTDAGDGTPGELVTVVGKEQSVPRQIGAVILANPDMIAFSANSGTFDGYVWDAQLGDFTLVPDGQYVYKISARLGGDFDWQETIIPFGVDTSAPEVTVGELDGSTLTITVTDEGSGLAYSQVAQSYMLTVSTVDGRELDVVEVSDGVFEVELPEGARAVTITANDFAFNETMFTEFVGGAELALSAPGTDPEFNIYGEDFIDFDTGEFYVSGYATENIASIEVNGVAADLYDGEFFASIPVVEGPNDLEVVAFDEAGNEVDRIETTFIYDAEPPVVEVTNLNELGEVPVNADGSVTVEGVITDSRPDAVLEVFVDSEEATVNPDGTFTYTTEPDYSSTSITVNGWDGANATSDVFFIEGQTPEDEEEEWGFFAPYFTNVACQFGFSACFVMPENSADLIDENTFLLKGYIGDPISKFTVTPTSYVDESGQFVHPQPIEVVADAEGYFEFPVELGVGMNDFRVEVWDADGEKVVDESSKIYFDMVMPTISFDEPTLLNGTLFTNEDRVVFKGTASDDGWGYTLLLNDSVIEEVFYNSGIGPESNERSFEVELAVLDGDQLLIHFVDANGNSLVGVIPVVVDKVAPVIEHSIDDRAVLSNQEVIETTATDENLKDLTVRVESLGGGYSFEETVSADVTLSEEPVEHSLLPDLPEAEEWDDDWTDEGLEGESTTEDAEGEDIAAGEVTEDVAPVETDDTAPLQTEDNVFGTRAATANTVLTQSFETGDVPAGHYVLTAISTDLAGNVSTSIVTFKKDDAPVITGPDRTELAIDREILGDSAELADLVLDSYTVVDDGTWNGGGDASLALAPGTVLVEGENQVTLIATDVNGQRVTRDVTVVITLNERTLEDNGVTATGTFRSDDSITVTIAGNNPRIVTVMNEFATIPAIITIAGDEDAIIYQVIGDNGRLPVEATWANGVWTINGSSKAVYVIENPRQAVDPDPILPIEPDRPFPIDDIVKDPDKGDTTPGKPGAGPSKPLAKTGAEMVDLIAISALFTAAGLLALALRRRIS